MKGFRKIVSSLVSLSAVVLGLVVVTGPVFAQGNPPVMDQEPLSMPPIGSNALRVITPTLLELVLINTKAPDPAQITQWNFVSSTGVLTLPAASEFVVSADGRPIAVQSVGFKRRALSAPLIDYPKTINDRDLRISNSIYLTLASPIAENETVVVQNPSNNVWPASMSFVDTADPFRWSPAIHVNQVGYMPGQAKKAMVGYYLGNMGELDVGLASFKLVDTQTQTTVFQGTLTARPDVGFTMNPMPYQKVMQADFTGFNTPGEYQLVVPGLGASFPFFINDGIAAASARAYALGLYHQRCGTALTLPFTRHTHGVCHAAAAEIPTASHPTWTFIGQVGQALTPSTILYPYINQGTVDVSLGHHDAGDYSKYTINSAELVHHLVFAADAFPGVGALDNMGIPESGDGKSDILQEAKQEADFLAKMQDSDGGFYFLVYPRARKYESNVTPDHGDTQVVWPKQTAVTAAAVAALAEAASSPMFKQQFPAEAALYMQKAQLGWTFLENAIAKYGKAGSYQVVTHYGNVFGHDDELTWAAAAMFVATGDPKYQAKMMEWMPDPTVSTVKRWGWWRLFEGYGGAIRDYAFAARTGRLDVSQLNAAYLAKCESEVKAAGQDQLNRANGCAYGSSLPNDNKRSMNPGWYFSAGQAFDLAAAYQLNPSQGIIDAIVSNMNYEFGCNPVNMTFVTGTGWKHQRCIVSQFGQNDTRILPPSGLPTGNFQEVFQYLEKFPELRGLSYPADVRTAGGYALYDRWADTWNVNTEAVVADQARGLACMAFLMTKTPLKDQPWTSAAAQITGLPSQAAVSQPVTASLQVSGMSLTNASIIWESKDLEPGSGKTFTLAAKNAGTQWVEAEALWPDGRRVFAQASYQAGGSGTPPPIPTVSVTATDASASETPPDNGTYTFTRTGATTAALTVNYSVSGTATGGTDYNALPGSVTIPAGAASATATVTPIADTLTEGTETVIVGISANAAYQIGAPSSATVNIADVAAPVLPTVSVSATDPSASEVGPDNGTFIITRTGSTSASLAVSYSMSGTATNGTDYTLVSGLATIPAGAASTTVVVQPVADSSTEGSESAILTLGSSALYQVGSQSNATVSIADAPPPPPTTPVVSISATDPNAAESGDTGTIVLSRTGSTTSSLTVNYTLSGTASYGTDYTLSGSATIPAGASSNTVTVVPKSDSLTEGSETVVCTISAGTGYQLGSSTVATVTIADAATPPPPPPPTLPSVTISATDASASEAGPDNGTFTITRSGSTSASLTVNYSVGGSATNGTDYNSIPTTATIPAGSASTTVTVVPKADSVNEGTETVLLSVSANSAYQVGSPSSATVNIANSGTTTTLPAVSVSGVSNAVESSSTVGRFSISRTGSTSASLTVKYTLGGVATNGVDYVLLSGTVIIPAGSASTNINVTPIQDGIKEMPESVTLSITTNSSYTLGGASTASITISD